MRSPQRVFTMKHTMKRSATRRNQRGRLDNHKSAGLLRIPVFLGGLSILGVVLASSTNVQESEHSPRDELERMVTHSLTLPKEQNPLASTTPAGEPQSAPQDNWKTITIKAGDSPSSIFSELNIHSQLHEVLKNETTRKVLSSIRPGDKIQALVEGKSLIELVYKPSKTTELKIVRTNAGLQSELIEHDVETRQVTKQVTIENSLYLDGKRAGLSDNMIMQLVGVFAYDIDFALDIRKGDSFKVIFEERFLEGEKLKDGALIGAEFTNKGKTYRAFRYTDANGNSDYYSEKGRSLKKAFIRSPVKFARISSPFNPKRMHPVLHTIRAHKGVDYAAKSGTPIRATGGGKIIFRGRKGGYGNVIIVQHGKRYTTLYAHMKNFRKGFKVGSRVKQGQIIGYVGKSGRATGPHLHYEFRVNGVHKNPVTVKLPTSRPLPKSEMARFTQQIAPALALLKSDSLVATAD